MGLELKLINEKEFYAIADASEIIGGLYHDSTAKSVGKRIGEWALKGYMDGIVVKDEKENRLYVRKEWADKFAKTKKYRIEEASEILGIPKRTFWTRANLANGNYFKIHLKQLPSRIHCITEEEINRLKNLIYVGSGVLVDGIGRGKVGKIIPCKAYDDNTIYVDGGEDTALNYCRDCKTKSERVRYVLDNFSSIGSFPGFCRKIVQKI